MSRAITDKVHSAYHRAISERPFDRQLHLSAEDQVVLVDMKRVASGEKGILNKNLVDSVVRLKDGYLTSSSWLIMIRKNLQEATEGNPHTLNEFIKKCQYPEYELLYPQEERLKRFGLINDDGSVDPSTRSITLNSIIETPEGVRWVNPIAE